MTVRSTYVGRCPVCDTVQPVSDMMAYIEGESPGRFMLIHAEFNLRCCGSGARVYGWWTLGKEPPPLPAY